MAENTESSSTSNAKKKKTTNPEAMDRMSKPKRLYRSESNKMIAGVAGGLGDFFDIDPVLIRVIFLLMTVFGGSGILIYLILWLLIPSESNADRTSEQTIRDNVDEFKEKAKSVHAQMQSMSKQDDNRNFWGLILVGLGSLFLLDSLGFIKGFDLGKLWPLFLIVLGVGILMKKK